MIERMEIVERPDSDDLENLWVTMAGMAESDEAFDAVVTLYEEATR